MQEAFFSNLLDKLILVVDQFGWCSGEFTSPIGGAHRQAHGSTSPFESLRALSAAEGLTVPPFDAAQGR